MARAIDGDKLVEDLRLIATCWSVSSFVSKEKHNGAIDMLKEVEREVKELPTLTPPNEWVSVEERLPEPGRRVIASCGYFVGEAWLSVSGEWYRHDGFAWDNLDSDVTHWMPLPAPPDRRPPEGEEENACWM